uniref:uncharacterized protein LOC101308501 n=1 Tax=Fragaria vesca subsp. vesca TaxID=101020 RepID=UPI0005CA5780|nr:PREDICTED: uncharacterized protein LOC101308501 [Fragaria vesca subsp. vesca]
MWRWFDLRLDRPKSKLLKMAVGAMDQVAFTDRELAGRPQKASLCLTPENAVLVSKTEAADAFFVLRIPERLMSSFECYESCNLQIYLHTLHRHLKQLEDKTEFAEIALYCEDPTQSANAVINFELDENAPKFHCFHGIGLRLTCGT